MTRENKLALVIGFGLILFVGILISDHLSAANRQDTADFTAGHQPAAASWEEFYDLQDYGPAGQQVAHHVEAPAEFQNEVPREVPREVAAARPVNHAGGMNPHAPAMGASEWTIQTPGIGSRSNAATPAREMGSGDGASNASGQLSNPMSNPLYVSHEIRPGESLAAISKKYYGDESMVKKIAALNKISNPNLVQSGDKLKLPKAGIVQMVKNGAQSPKQPAPKKTAPAGGSGDSGGEKTYTIKSGDVLSRIASREMGSSRHWKKLYDHNRNVLKDPDNIPAGVVIRIPK